MSNAIQKLRNRAAGKGEGGFSLIELLVVVLIIGILLAIAIPTFLNQREKAQARDPQSALTNSLIAAKSYFTDNGEYTGLTPALLASSEPAYGYIAAAAINDTNKKTAGERTVAMALTGTGAATVITMFAKGDNGVCYGIRDTPTGATAGTTYGSVTGDCPAAGPATITASKW